MQTVKKIFAIWIIEQTWGKLKDHVPKDQPKRNKHN